MSKRRKSNLKNIDCNGVKQENSVVRFCRFVVPALFFLAACAGGEPQKRLDFSVKNSSSIVLTVIYQDETNIRMIDGFCFKFASEDFPLTVVFNNYETSLTLNEPAHYIIEGTDGARKLSSPCRSDEIE